mgnify:CR=1 FL=1
MQYAALDRKNNVWGFGETERDAITDASEQSGFDGRELLVRECSDYVSEQLESEFPDVDVVLMFRAAKKTGETELLLKQSEMMK